MLVKLGQFMTQEQKGRRGAQNTILRLDGQRYCSLGSPGKQEALLGSDIDGFTVAYLRVFWNSMKYVVKDTLNSIQTDRLSQTL